MSCSGKIWAVVSSENALWNEKLWTYWFPFEFTLWMNFCGRRRRICCPIWKKLFGVSGVWPGLLFVHFVKITIEVLQNIDKKWTQIIHILQK
jgi:hypothetical protein